MTAPAYLTHYFSDNLGIIAVIAIRKSGMSSSPLSRIRQWLCRPVDSLYANQYSVCDQAIMSQCRSYTMTSTDRMGALLEAVEYVIRRDIPGAFAECGVWRGGSVLAMLLKLKELGVSNRDVYLYDTFEGMTEPGAQDTSTFHPPARQAWDEAKNQGKPMYDALFNPETFNESQVRKLLIDTGYPKERLHFVRGPVEQTIPATLPDRIALLRLDTDWYESTRHELEHLYPRLERSGVLIIDDYGHWEGARKATDEYFSSGKAAPVFLHRVDYTARLAIKT